MLSYRHAFHAGNHADVLKHWVQTCLLGYLNQKEKPYWYVDTHAGAGGYALDSGYASKNAEYESGIARLWAQTDLPPTLAAYVDLVRAYNAEGAAEGALRVYPGSPHIAAHLLREQDRHRLFELHPTDFALLQNNTAHLRKQAVIQGIDGFAGLKSVLPPAPRRALVLIDPPYEDKTDYRRVVRSLEDALQRFATGIYAVWYPKLQRPEVRELLSGLKALPAKSWLHVSLTVQAPSLDGFGMHGSGMFVLNPPWTLVQDLQAGLPYLAKVLAQDTGAGFLLEQSEA